MQFSLIFHGEPVPNFRPRFNGKFAYNDKRYMNYKAQLAAEIKYLFREYITRPPAPNTPARSQYLQANRYKLSVKAFRSCNRGDVDNFLKTIQDALQDSGLILDDSQLDKVIAEKFIDKMRPRIEFTLTKLQNTEQMKLLES